MLASDALLPVLCENVSFEQTFSKQSNSVSAPTGIALAGVYELKGAQFRSVRATTISTVEDRTSLQHFTSTVVCDKQRKYLHPTLNAVGILVYAAVHQQTRERLREEL